MADDPIDYRVPGPLTDIQAVGDLPSDPVAICAVAQGLVIQPQDASAAGIAEDRLGERNIRSARSILDVVFALDPAPLTEPRTADRRVVGTCRHFAVLSCALLRSHGIPARARCGFATYFVPGKSVDHWITEYRNGDGRWVRVDSETIDTDIVADPADLRPGQFLTGGEGWQRWRAGAVDPDTFGVVGTDHAWGIGEIRGNAIRDLAALCKIEMLPWDEWGRMDDSYHGRTGREFDALMDTVAAATASDDLAKIEAVYRTEDLAVPAEMVH